VKNLYEDAMKDELLVKYLPTKEQLSGRLPERDFLKKQGVSISEAWMAEVQKHPCHSSKLLLLTLVEKPGTGIFLKNKTPFVS
jgi:hypothetical protein